jgi:uridylate kinase
MEGFALVRFVVRIGGSVIASPPDPGLMERYVNLLRELKKQGHEFVVVVGGGSTARDFIKIAEKMGLAEVDQDEIAIAVSRIYAQLLARKLGDLSSKDIPESVDEAVAVLESGKTPVMGGLKPGITTDTVATIVAERTEADLLVKATDQDGVYTKDPRKHPEAKKIDSLSFENLLGLFEENKHKAGIHQILDPEAVRLLQKRRIKTVVVNGFNPENITLAVKCEKVGTIIQ